MKKMMKKIKQIANDKLMHFIAGAGIAEVTSIIMTQFTTDIAMNCGIGFVAALFAGFGKEIYDEIKKKDSSDKWDYFATVVGGITGALVMATSYIFA